MRNVFRARTNTGGRNRVAQKISIRGPQASLRGGELEVVQAEALEERPHGLEKSRRVEVEDDYIVEVGRHLFQALCDPVDNLEKLRT